jgi:hypothetical protein
MALRPPSTGIVAPVISTAQARIERSVPASSVSLGPKQAIR